MTYMKPDISVIGDAGRAIQRTGRKLGDIVFDPGDQLFNFNPAYDLDD